MAGEEVHTIWDNAGLRGAALREAEVARQRGTRRRELDDVDKFAFIQSLGIDPIKESEMIWIAEEALAAQLPPGWTEQVDDRGRSFFFHGSTAESSWLHPLQSVFQDLVEYYRQVIEEGGFWMVEDQLADLEEKIRRELADWQELFDEKSQKFYYNRQTEESRLEDPRHAVYHCLYVRVKMVGKMRERLPHLAAVPRPEDPELLRARRRDEKQRQAEVKVTLKIQSVCRMMMARRKAQEQRRRRMMNLVVPSKQSELTLSLQRTGHGGCFKEDLVISLPPGRRRALAIVRLQAFFRGVLVRKRYRGMVRHRTMLRRSAKKIQLHYRLFMATRWALRERDRRRTAAAHTILEMVHSLRDRRIFRDVLDADVLARRHRMNSIIKIQSLFRANRDRAVFKARREVCERAVLELQATVRKFQAQRALAAALLREEPAQLVFEPNGDARSAGLLPWSWRLMMLPTDDPAVSSSHRVEDLFASGGTGSPELRAAQCIQKWARGKKGRRLARERDQFLRAEARRKAKEAARLPFSATEVQRRWKGFMVRRRNVLDERRREIYAQKMADVQLVLAYLAKVKAQGDLMFDLKMETANVAATVIQTRWRQRKATRVVEQLREESLWPLKSCFEFFATGAEAARCSVRFYANPRFDHEKFFDQKGQSGSGYSMPELLDSMEDEVEACVRRFLKDQERADKERLGPPPVGGGWLDSLDAEPEPSEPSEPSVDEEEEVEPPPSPPKKKKEHQVHLPKGLERMHYAGAMINGRFVKSNVTSLDQLSPEDKEAIVADINASRQQRLEELKEKQRKHAAWIMQQHREAARRLAETRKVFRRSKSDLDPRLQPTTMPPPRAALLQDLVDDPSFKRLAQAEKLRQAHSGEASPKRALPASPQKGLLASPGTLPRVPHAAVSEMTPSPSTLRKLHGPMHKHQEQFMWKAGGDSSPVSPAATTLPRLPAGRLGLMGATSTAPAFLGHRPKLERAASAGELTRSDTPTKGKGAMVRGVPLEPSSWQSPGSVDSFAQTVRRNPFREDVLPVA